MKLNYYPENASLYINLSEQPSLETHEISEGVLLDYDAGGRLVGIDIDNASTKVEMEKLILSKIPCNTISNRLDFIMEETGRENPLNPPYQGGLLNGIHYERNSNRNGIRLK